jgi:thioredoxin 1
MKFHELINQNTPVIVDFYADWCGPCKAMAPIIEQVADELGEKAKVIKVDVDKNQAAAQKYGVRSIPTLLVFKNGKIKWRQAGVVSADQLKLAVNQIA